jgi:hypothetical protein
MERFARLAAAALLLSVAACGKDKEPGKAPSADTPVDPAITAAAEPAAAPASAEPIEPAPVAAAAAAAAGTIAPRKLAAADLAGDVAFDGELVEALGWTDASGDNVAVLAIAGKDVHRNLRVVHVAGPKGSRKTVREVKESFRCEDGDLTAEFVPAATSVTDLDGDKLGELTFAYKLACRTDMSPADLKLLVLENGDKHILRGQTRINEGSDSYGGGFKPEPAKGKWPAGFFAHAESTWKKVETEF